MNKEKEIHIALDFDKTLAYHESVWGISRVGEPILPMVKKVKKWLAKGYKVTIFSARMSHDYYVLAEQIKFIKDFLKKAGLPDLPKTATKRAEFTHYIDDRAYHVKRNEGIISDEIDI